MKQKVLAYQTLDITVFKFSNDFLEEENQKDKFPWSILRVDTMLHIF